MPGPIPDPNARRRNAPTIPTTDLPAGGRAGRSPTPPSRYRLSNAGRQWWAWAWHTPQAAAWDGGGFEELVARRAALEDDLAAIARPHGLDLRELEAATSPELAAAVRSVAALATGRLAILKECREIDDRLGLTPRGLAALRWRVLAAPEEEPEVAAPVDEVEQRRRERLARAVGGPGDPEKPVPKKARPKPAAVPKKARPKPPPTAAERRAARIAAAK